MVLLWFCSGSAVIPLRDRRFVDALRLNRRAGLAVVPLWSCCGLGLHRCAEVLCSRCGVVVVLRGPTARQTMCEYSWPTWGDAAVAPDRAAAPLWFRCDLVAVLLRGRRRVDTLGLNRRVVVLLW